MAGRERIRKIIENFIDLYGGVIVVTKTIWERDLVKSLGIKGARSYSLLEFGDKNMKGITYPVVGVSGSLFYLKDDISLSVMAHNDKIYNK